MKIDDLVMEDWLAENQFVKYNLAESGVVDLSMGELLDICEENIDNLKPISLINPDTKGSFGLRQEICKCYKNVEIENILVTTGMSEALFSFFNTMLEPGDEVIVEFPEFQPLYQVPAAIGCKIKFLNVLECAHFIPEPEPIEKLITDKTRLIIINNPHNPTGSTADSTRIKEIAEIARSNDLYLLFDEHYLFMPLEPGADLLPSGFDISYHIHKKIAATGSVTKCFGLNGLRVAWLIASPDILNKCRNYKDYLTHVTPPISTYLGMVALKNKEKMLRLKKEIILTNLNLLNSFMKQNNDFFEYQAPTGGVVCFPRLTHYRDSKDFCMKLLDQYGISLLPGFAFDTPGYFRLNIGIKSQEFQEALDLMQKFIVD